MSAIPSALRKLVHERDEGRCQRCGAFIGSRPRSLHHRRARGMGGSRLANTAANLILLCGTGTTGCHGWIESNRTKAEKLGFLVRQGHNPALIPVLRFMRRRELPTDNGWIPFLPSDDHDNTDKDAA